MDRKEIIKKKNMTLVYKEKNRKTLQNASLNNFTKRIATINVTQRYYCHLNYREPKEKVILNSVRERMEGQQ